MAYFEFTSVSTSSDEPTHAPLPPPALNEWLDNYPVLALEYSGLCYSLMALLSHIKTPPDDDRNSEIYVALLTEKLEEAHRFNRLLHYTFQHTSFHYSAKKTLEAHQGSLATLAIDLGLTLPPFPVNEIEQTPPFFQTQTMDFRTKTGRANPYRLLAFPRLRRFFVNLQTFLTTMPEKADAFARGFRPLDLVYGWLANILSWLFLLPRLLINLFLTAWHVIPHRKLTQQEQQLTWQQRLKIQWRERWFELANDGIWVPGGILGCFVLVGSLGIIGAYLTVAMFCWDVLMSSIRAIQELSRLSDVIDQHISHKKTLPSDEQQLAHQTFINHLKKHLVYEKMRHALSVSNNVLVTGLTFVALSCLVFPILVPLIASGCLLALTLVQVGLGKYIDQQKPRNPLSDCQPDDYREMLSSLRKEGPTPDDLLRATSNSRNNRMPPLPDASPACYTTVLSPNPFPPKHRVNPSQLSPV